MGARQEASYNQILPVFKPSSSPTTTPVGKCAQNIKYHSKTGTDTIAKGTYIHAAAQTKQTGNEGDGYTAKVTLEGR